jgi:hypothetical protein
VSGWRDISTAPRNGTAILAYSEVGGTGTLLVKWSCPAELLPESELEALSEDELWEGDWFLADFTGGARLDSGCPLTGWLPVPSQGALNPCKALGVFQQARDAYVAAMNGFQVEGDTEADRRFSERERTETASESMFEVLAALTFEDVCALLAEERP